MVNILPYEQPAVAGSNPAVGSKKNPAGYRLAGFFFLVQATVCIYLFKKNYVVKPYAIC